MGNKQIKEIQKNETNTYTHYIFKPGTMNLYNVNSNNKNIDGKTPKDILESVDVFGKNIKSIKVNCGGIIAMDKIFPPNTNSVYKLKLCNMNFPLFLLDFHHSLSIVIESDCEVNVIENHREPLEHELAWKIHKKITLPLYKCIYKNITFKNGLMFFK